MKSDFLIISIIILVILISGCTQTGYVVNPNENATNMTNETTTTIQESTTSTIASTVQEKHCPACNDNNSCTEEKCSSETNYECTYKAITPCCSNGVCEDNEFNCNEDCITNISITNINYESPEWVEIKNSGDAANLTGWTLEDPKNHKYTFPNFIFHSNSSVKIHTGSGTNNQTDLYWGYSDNASVWNTEGDNATLRNEKGDIVDEYSYLPTTTTTTTTTTSTTITSTTTTTIQETTTTTIATTTSTTIPMNHLLISEVYYDTLGTDSKEEWISLYNPNENSIDLGGYIIRDNNDNWTIPSQIITGMGYKIIARDETGFYNLYSCYPDFDGLTLSLANTGDNLTLEKDEQEIDFVEWGNDNWNISSGTNSSIIRINNTDTNSSADWTINQIPDPCN